MKQLSICILVMFVIVDCSSPRYCGGRATNIAYIIDKQSFKLKNSWGLSCGSMDYTDFPFEDFNYIKRGLDFNTVTFVQLNKNNNRDDL